ncbi:NUDIX hydrolase [Streptomyces globosus]|uniref:NUDIX hydrolase n=1 Tax=Streptomyces globosus TaxID=68209 RepID=UPI003822F645
MPDRRSARPADRPAGRTVRPARRTVRPARGPGPLLTAAAVVVDGAGRVLVRAPGPAPGRPGLPGGAVAGGETPEAGLARALARELGLHAPVGRLLAVDSRPAAGPRARAGVVHLHLVGPLGPQETAAAAAVLPGWVAPQEAYALLPEPDAARLRAALAALHTGSVAHLAGGVAQPGSPAGLDPARRSALEHAGALDAASHRAARPKALTAASALLTDAAGRVLLVEPAYGRRGRWNLPGGGVDSDLGETPRAAVRREVREELGLDVEPGRLLAVNWSHKPGYPARIRFLYDGGVLDAAALAAIRLPPGELLAWHLAPADSLRDLVKPSLRRQIKASLRARAQGTGPLELHAGRPAGGG